MAKDIKSIGKAIGAEWQKLSDSEKKAYTDKANAAKAAHEAAHGPIVRGAKKEKAGKAGKAAKEDGPKRPTSAYMYFSKDMSASVRAANPGKPITEVAKVVGEKWKNMSESEKHKYDLLAAKDKARYEAERAK